MTTSEVIDRLGVPVESLAQICRRWGVRELAVFGSMARGDQRPDSDVDFLVEFQSESRPHGWGFVDLMLELEDLIGKPVDLVELAAVENPFRRQLMLKERTVLYAG